MWVGVCIITGNFHDILGEILVMGRSESLVVATSMEMEVEAAVVVLTLI